MSRITMYKEFIQALVIFLTVSNVFAVDFDNKEHEIDKWTMQALKNTDSVTFNIIEVYKVSYNKWDSALNQAYNLLISRLSDNNSNLLRDSQRKWLQYRDAEFEFMKNHILQYEGTISRLIVYHKMNEFVRGRVLELESYIAINNSPP